MCAMARPPDEHRRIWEEAWQQAKAAKAKRRAENRSSWRNSPSNAMAARDIAAAIPADIEDDATSPSLAELRRLMADIATPLHRRLDASEVILQFELPQGAAVGADIEQIGASSYKFLRAVSADPQTPEALKFKSLKLLAGIENARASSRSTAAELFAKKALLIGAANAERRRAMLAAHAWPPGVAGERWWLDTSDTIAWPPQWPGLWEWPPASIAHHYKGGDPAAFQAMLRTVRATNRPDDFWDRFGAPAA
jgi:hypothetical protein